MLTSKIEGMKKIELNCSQVQCPGSLQHAPAKVTLRLAAVSSSQKASVVSMFDLIYK